MRKLILAALVMLGASGAAFGQQPPARTPLVSELLPLISVSPPQLERISNRDSQLVRHRLAGVFDVFNASEFDVIDLKMQCDWLAPSGSRLGTFELTLFSAFPGRGRGRSAPTNEREAPEQTVGVTCAARDLRIVGWRPPPPPPPPVAERQQPPPGEFGAHFGRVACPPSQCPDYSERLRTCDCDLKQELVNFAPNPIWLVARPPKDPRARNFAY